MGAARFGESQREERRHGKSLYCGFSEKEQARQGKKKKKSLRLINLKNFSIPWGLRAALVLWCLDQG